MFTEARKIHLIEEIIKITSEDTLRELETVLEKSKTKSKKVKKLTPYDLVGVWTKKDAKLIEKAIEEGCGQVNPDDWK